MVIRDRVKRTAKKVVRRAARQVLATLESPGGDEVSASSTRDFGLDEAPREPTSPAPALEEPLATAHEAEPVAESLKSDQSPLKEEEPMDEPKKDTVLDEGLEQPAAPALSKLSESERETMRETIVEMIQTVHDPEIPVNIYELGLIYDIDVGETGHVEVKMTLTSPNCPAAQSLPGEVELKTGSVENVRSVMVDVGWDPPWEPSMMSEGAQLELNMF